MSFLHNTINKISRIPNNNHNFQYVNQKAPVTPPLLQPINAPVVGLSAKTSMIHELSFSNVIDLAMVIGPSLGFFIQILKIQKQKSSEGFSRLLILILLIANILRIFFWLGKHFSNVLLYQSFLMIATQFYLLYVCLYYSPTSHEKRINYDDDEYPTSAFQEILGLPSSLSQRFFSYKPPKIFSLSDFWQWPFFIDYVFFISLFTVSIEVLSRIIGYSNLSYIELLGFFAAGVEALIGVPQAISNYMNETTGALSFGMILTWIFGDTFKTFYYFSTHAPVQLLLCGIFQLVVDIVIVLQIFYYSGKFNDLLPQKYLPKNERSMETLHNDLESGYSIADGEYSTVLTDDIIEKCSEIVNKKNEIEKLFGKKSNTKVKNLQEEQELNSLILDNSTVTSKKVGNSIFSNTNSNEDSQEESITLKDYQQPKEEKDENSDEIDKKKELNNYDRSMDTSSYDINNASSILDSSVFTKNSL